MECRCTPGALRLTFKGGPKSSRNTVIVSSRGAPVITSFVTVERSTFSGLVGLFSVGWGYLGAWQSRATLNVTLVEEVRR